MRDNENLYSFLGFFADPIQEDEFQQSSFNKNKSQLRSIILLTGGSFFLLIFPDLFLLTEIADYVIIGFLRLTFVILSLLFCSKKSAFLSLKSLNQSFTIYISIGILFSLFILSLYHRFYFASSSYFFLCILLYLFFIIPLPLGNKNILAFASVIGFFSIAYFIHRTNLIEASSFLLFSVLAIIFFNYIIVHINQVQRERFLKESKLAVLNKEDPLTGIANRLKFNDFLEESLRFARRYHTPLTLILIEVNGLQSIQNRDGQEAGDAVLKEFTHSVTNQIREVDLLARVGGDEFTLLLPNTTKEDALIMIERVKETIKKEFSSKEKQISIIYGIAAYEEMDSFISFIKKADTSLFRAKKKRRGASKS